jgi:hypothetical protein
VCGGVVCECVREDQSLDDVQWRSYRPDMQTEIYESDPFSGSRGQHLASMETDYRFERNDELFLTAGGRRIKVRITHVRLEWDGRSLRRDLLALKL